MEKVQLFQDKKVRPHWDAEKEERYFSVVDAVGVLKDSPALRNYWKVLKHRLIETSNEAVTNCNRLKMLAQDGKVRITDVADKNSYVLYSLFHHLGLRLSNGWQQVGAKRLDEIADASAKGRNVPDFDYNTHRPTTLI